MGTYGTIVGTKSGDEGRGQQTGTTGGDEGRGQQTGTTSGDGERGHTKINGGRKTGTRVRSFKDLIVWQRAMDLSKAIYKLTASFPKDELYGLSAQMRRASVSIPSNIAEGQARGHRAEYRRFLYIALGSLAELETQLLLTEQLGLTSSCSQVIDRIGSLRLMLLRLARAL